MPRKIIVITKVVVKWNKLEEFNAYWQKSSLPKMSSHGASHFGSFECYLGGKKNEIIRITEFDDLSKWEEWMKMHNSISYSAEPTSQERAGKIADVTSMCDSLEETVWFSIYN